MPVQVEAGEDDHLPVVVDMNEPVGETPRHGPPHLAFLIKRRIGPQMALEASEFVEEFEAEPLALLPADAPIRPMLEEQIKAAE